MIYVYLHIVIGFFFPLFKYQIQFCIVFAGENMILIFNFKRDLLNSVDLSYFLLISLCQCFY